MKNTLHSASLIALLAAGTTASGLAAEDSAADLETIVVTANRREQPLSEIGSSVSVLTEQDLKNSQETFVLEALQAVPGLAISQNGAFGGTASVSLRGTGGDNTVLLIDGVQMNDASATGGGYNFGTLDTHNVARIEVLRGPQSVLYGSDAIGGVINIVTKTGGEGFGGDVFVEGGSFDSWRGGATLFGGSEQLGFNLSASITDTDGISAADENDGNSERDGLESINLSGKVTSKLSDAVSLEFITRYSDNESEFDNFGPVDGDQVARTDEFAAVGRAYIDLLDGKLQNTISFEYSEIDRENLAAGVQTYEAKGKRYNVDYLGVYEASDLWTLTFGAQRETAKATNLTDEGFSINSLFGELAFAPGEALVLTAGVRHDDHETFGGATTARFTGSYEIGDTGTRLIANYGEGFKAPSVFQLTYICGFCGLTEPSSDLQPEEAEGYEFGVEQSLADDTVILSATYFNMEAENVIDFTFTGGYQNVAAKASEGIELGLKAHLADSLDVTANYTWTDAKDLVTDAPAARQPRHLFTGAVNWAATDKLSLRASIIRNGAEEQSFGAGTLEAWTRVDLRASFEVSEGLSIFGRIDNAFDKEYQHVLGYGTPDRFFNLGVRKTW